MLLLVSCNDAAFLLDTTGSSWTLIQHSCWYHHADIFAYLHRGAELCRHWRGAANVLNLHRVNTVSPCSDSLAAARPEAESHHHTVLHCAMLLWLLAATVHHAGGPKDHE